MPKEKKTAISRGNRPQKKQRSLETADDWLEEALSLEDSGDRWVQDPPKAHRFYIQALAGYERALSPDASLFDAAYNRARLFLQISQVCALLARPRLKTIKQAITAHQDLSSRYPTNSDVRYNLALVLMSYAEVAMEHKVLEAVQEDGSVPAALVEALEHLRWCREKQTSELSELAGENNTAESGIVDDDQHRDQVADTIEEEDDDSMAVSVTYISNDIILDTLISTLECYAILLGLDNLRDISVVENAKDYIFSVVLPQINAVLPLCHAEEAVNRLAATTHSVKLAELEFSYHQNLIDISTWKSQLEQALSDTTSIPILCDNADACKSLASSMASSDIDQSESWKVLSTGASSQITKAIEQMTQSGRKAPNLYLTKADIEMLRANVKCPIASRNRGTLLKNATVYYKHAVADCLPKDLLLKNEAALKLAIVEGQISDTTPSFPEMSRDEAEQIIANAREDGLFEGSWKLLDGK